jgi:hypothetical protein
MRHRSLRNTGEGLNYQGSKEMIFENLVWIAVILCGALCLGAWIALRASNPDKGVLSLAATIVLCLPSVISGLGFLVNLLLQGHFGEWTQGSQLFVGLGTFFGSPLVIIAAFLCIIVAFRPLVALRIKAAHLIVVGLGAIATISLLLFFHFTR